MPRQRKNKADSWMPPRVYRGKSAYEWHPSGGGCVRLCALDAPQSKVLEAYEDAQKDGLMDVERLVKAFFKSPQFAELKPATQKDYRQGSKSLIAVFGKMLPDRVTAQHIRQYMDERGKVSRVRANRERALVKTIFGWAYERGIVSQNPADGVRMFREKPRDRYVSDEEYQAVYNVAPKHVQIAMEVAYLCAARQGDVLKLRWSDVTDKGLYIEQGKTGKKQIKLWTPRLREAIESTKRLHGDKVESIYILHNKRGQKYTETGFKALFRKALIAWLGEDAKASHPSWFTFHDLKAKGITDYEGDKRDFAGHYDSRITQRVYNRRPDEVQALEPKKK